MSWARDGYLAQYDKLQEAAGRLLEEQVEQMREAGGTVTRAHLRMGRPDEEIVGLSEEVGRASSLPAAGAWDP